MVQQMFRDRNILQQFLLLLLIVTAFCDDENQGVRYANRCEACKILATELQQRVQETGKIKEIIEIGYSLDDVKPKKRTAYHRSELRLLESTENVCERILEYSLHKERHDSTRFAKGMPQTFKTLHGLVQKGVKVDLGIPYDMWDTPPIEITHMKAQCEDMLEKYEDVISEWYFKFQDETPLIKHLCEERVLNPDEQNCLYEVYVPKEEKIDLDELKELQRDKCSKIVTNAEKDEL